MKNPVFEATISWSEITNSLKKLKGRHFVYLLLKGSEVIYVGRSSNLYNRLVWHKYRKDFINIHLAEFKTHLDCRHAEKKIVKYYLPEKNIVWVKYGK